MIKIDKAENKYFIKEVLVKSIIIIISFYFFRSLVLSSNSRLILKVFPNTNSLFSLYKFFFLAVTLLVVAEYLIMFELPPNFLLSRVIGLLVMFLLTTVLYSGYYFSFGARIRTAFLLLTTAIAVIFGLMISYRIQKRRNLRWGYSLGFFNYFLIAMLLMGLSLANPQGFIFLDS